MRFFTTTVRFRHSTALGLLLVFCIGGWFAPQLHRVQHQAQALAAGMAHAEQAKHVHGEHTAFTYALEGGHQEALHCVLCSNTVLARTAKTHPSYLLPQASEQTNHKQEVHAVAAGQSFFIRGPPESHT